MTKPELDAAASLILEKMLELTKLTSEIDELPGVAALKLGHAIDKIFAAVRECRITLRKQIYASGYTRTTQVGAYKQQLNVCTDTNHVSGYFSAASLNPSHSVSDLKTLSTELKSIAQNLGVDTDECMSGLQVIRNLVEIQPAGIVIGYPTMVVGADIARLANALASFC